MKRALAAQRSSPRTIAVTAASPVGTGATEDGSAAAAVERDAPH